MTLKDARGLAVSTSNTKTLDGYEQALRQFHTYRGDPIETLDAVLAEDPEFVLGHCLRAEILCTFTEKTLEDELRHSVETAESLAGIANDRERQHIAAARAWLDGEFERSNRLLGRIVIDHPHDAQAVQVSHLTDFYLGQSQMLRDRMGQVRSQWSESLPGYGYVFGMHAFGLEQMGDFAHAEETGRQAVELNADDAWGVHAVAHVMEMQARAADGIDWMMSRVDDWSPDNGFAFHNWWHTALYHLDLGQHDRVLEIYDTSICPEPSGVALEMLDASAMLWRLHLRGADVGDRWKVLADAWAPKAEEAYYVFNDVHGMMALVADGRDSDAQRLLRAIEQGLSGDGTNVMMTRDVGLPVAQALYAFGQGDYAKTVDLLMPVRTIASRFGGSHAQRDIITLTLIEAAIRGGDAALARALACERLELQPRSPFAWEISARSRTLAGEDAAAAEDRAEAARRRKAAAPVGVAAA